MEEPKKNIDQSWKENAQKEKEELEKQGQFVPPEADFGFFVTTLAIQASIFLGVTANPASGKVEKDIAQAKFIIDTLGMLKEKTKGNLAQEEADMLENILYELRVAYLSKREE